MKVFSCCLKLRSGLPMGGYGTVRLSSSDCDHLEINGWSFSHGEDCNFDLFAIDALYAGDLAQANQQKDCLQVFAASHTHYAPMLDSSKPLLGSCVAESVDCYKKAIIDTPRTDVEPDICRIYRAELNVPVYRRFDYPDTLTNRFLTRYCGLYPNESLSIDNGLCIFEFAKGDVTLFTLVYHACHPVSRHDPMQLSPDYIGSIRNAIRSRFKAKPCLFLLGCAGDVRPNYPLKRVSLLPRSRFNWRFEPWASPESELNIDLAYSNAVDNASLWKSLTLGSESVSVEQKKISLIAQGDISFTRLVIGGKLIFEFLPFEVSHYFHMEAQQKNPMRFIVSCSNHTIGYLPHPKQLIAGGYEVDGSRLCMELSERVELRLGELW